MRIAAILHSTIALLVAVCASADTTVDPACPYAYAANAGWMNVAGDGEHGVQVGTSYCTGYMWSPCCGWIGFGNGPLNGWQYANNSAENWGVNHDGLGRLTGYAYGANIGWVTFEQTYGKPCVDLKTGVMSGSAWSPSIGWISFSNSAASVHMARLETGPDTDGDGIGDPWEYQHTGTLLALGGGSSDWDGDGVTDAAEFLADTDPADDTAYLHILSLLHSGTSDQITWTSQPSRLYRIERSDRLGEGAIWDDSELGVVFGTQTGQLIRTVASLNGTNVFYRVKALMPFSND